MLRIMWRRTTASMTKIGGRSSLAEEDLSSWEFVDAPLSDDEDIYSLDRDDVIPKDTRVEYEEEVDEDARDSGRPLDGVISVESLSSPPMTSLADVARHDMHHDGGHVYDDDDVHHDNEEEEDVYDDDDDELLTWKPMWRLEKRRIKKNGWRRNGGGPKLRKSKKLPYYYNRPGYLYGKHGLGVQHYYI
ncbi:hypothetical protein Salat_1604700 [Sesamum alatum]|uniref:Uncharacterized protein n=1 Tax=Sesamum alatum TaxID=300844 RepID=A0AAE2CJ60_9LAMI|nr:hypothetical protein Salat_1604700 [Sesamum alatum]